MSINTPSGNDALPPRPPSGNSGGGDERPGYPPPGQAERLAALQAGEAAAQTGDPGAALDADLAALETGAETAEERTVRLETFVKTHFFDVVPEGHRALAIDECAGFEDRCREVWEDSTLVLEDEDAEDPSCLARGL